MPAQAAVVVRAQKAAVVSQKTAVRGAMGQLSGAATWVGKNRAKIALARRTASVFKKGKLDVMDFVGLYGDMKGITTENMRNELQLVREYRDTALDEKRKIVMEGIKTVEKRPFDPNIEVEYPRSDLLEQLADVREERAALDEFISERERELAKIDEQVRRINKYANIFSTVRSGRIHLGKILVQRYVSGQYAQGELEGKIHEWQTKESILVAERNEIRSRIDYLDAMLDKISYENLPKEIVQKNTDDWVSEKTQLQEELKDHEEKIKILRDNREAARGQLRTIEKSTGRRLVRLIDDLRAGRAHITFAYNKLAQTDKIDEIEANIKKLTELKRQLNTQADFLKDKIRFARAEEDYWEEELAKLGAPYTIGKAQKLVRVGSQGAYNIQNVPQQAPVQSPGAMKILSDLQVLQAMIKTYQKDLRDTLALIDKVDRDRYNLRVQLQNILSSNRTKLAEAIVQLSTAESVTERFQAGFGLAAKIMYEKNIANQLRQEAEQLKMESFNYRIPITRVDLPPATQRQYDASVKIDDLVNKPVFQFFLKSDFNPALHRKAREIMALKREFAQDYQKMGKKTGRVPKEFWILTPVQKQHFITQYNFLKKQARWYRTWSRNYRKHLEDYKNYNTSWDDFAKRTKTDLDPRIKRLEAALNNPNFLSGLPPQDKAMYIGGFKRQLHEMQVIQKRVNEQWDRLDADYSQNYVTLAGFEVEERRTYVMINSQLQQASKIIVELNRLGKW